jgi:hypothetical protein
MKRTLFIILILVITIFLFKNMIVKTVVSAWVRKITGLTLEMKSLSLGIFTSLIDIKDLKLYNSAQYPEKKMLDMPEIHVIYDLGSLSKGKMHLKELRLNLKEFVVVKNQKGAVNLNSLKALQLKKGGQMPEIRIDTLELNIGKVVYKDFSQGGAPLVKEFNLNINESFKDLTNPYTLVSIIVAKALMNTTVSELAKFDLGPFEAELKNTINKAARLIQESAGKTVQTVGELKETFKEILPLEK